VIPIKESRLNFLYIPLLILLPTLKLKNLKFKYVSIFRKTSGGFHPPFRNIITSLVIKLTKNTLNKLSILK